MWFDFRQGQEIFFCSKMPRLALGSTPPPIQWVPEVKGPEHEADHSPSFTAKVNNEWIYASIPSYVFVA
jgi:hypothetical protein